MKKLLLLLIFFSFSLHGQEKETIPHSDHPEVQKILKAHYDQLRDSRIQNIEPVDSLEIVNIKT